MFPLAPLSGYAGTNYRHNTQVATTAELCMFSSRVSLACKHRSTEAVRLTILQLIFGSHGEYFPRFR